jgi:16S rRNA pseudouridine516 synthase
MKGAFMLYYMFNKPRGCVTACSDEVHRTVMDYFPHELREKLHPVGRLDKDTCGLLILTDDGFLDQKIMQPRSHVSKTYFFYAIGSMDGEKQSRLREGIAMSGFITGSAVFRLIKEYRIADLEDFMPEYRRERYMKNPEGAAFVASLTIHEGKKHEVKRMLEAVGCRIFYLRRESIGGLSLDQSLPEGSFRPLTEQELELLTE